MSKKRKAIGTDTIAMHVIKAQEEKRFTYGLAYPAMKADTARAADGMIDFASASVIEAASWAWMLKSRDVGLMHDDSLGGGHAQVVESHIWRGEPWTTKAADGSMVTISPGDWCIGVIWSPQAWEQVRKGLIRGYSMQGAARRSKPSKGVLAKLRR